MLHDLTSSVPARATISGDTAPDDSTAIFGLLLRGQSEGLRGALLTLVDREGGSARPVGAQMAVLEDGRFTGYLSSGCLEAVIAAEAVVRITRRQNGVLRFGAGSPFLDIRLPCGGSIDVLVDVTLTQVQVRLAAEKLRKRRPFSLASGLSKRSALSTAGRRTGWHDETFTRSYAPALQIAAAGRGLEFEAVVKLAVTAGYGVQAFCADDGGVERLGGAGIGVTRLSSPSSPPELPLDANTALVLVFHDHEWETALLDKALKSDCRYIGAMGSARTHRRRCERLLAAGHSLAETDRIRGPIGLFGPTRNASTLAISVLAELVQIAAADD
jgi:xanthine dehydrogenase accessory factor